jgi:hypothetical protein
MVRFSARPLPHEIEAAAHPHLACNFVFVVLFAVAPATALAQTAMPGQPPSPLTTAAQSERGPLEKASVASEPVRSLPLELTADPNQGTLSTFSSPWNWHFDIGSQTGCQGCGADGIQPPTNPNAPWMIKGQVSYTGAGGTLITVGAIGSRNNRLPLFMSQPLGVNQDLTPQVSSSADLSRNTIQWQLTASVKKTLKRMSGGQTIGLVGDVFIPIGSEDSHRNPEGPVLQSKAIRAGLMFGF